ncbi:MAG TPA: outer membrane beta-barrel protein [Thermoanaerobaculia bacterium]|nr:outer membrane beta-barrel protein [Thermoanaerobaculia bacterium]
MRRLAVCLALLVAPYARAQQTPARFEAGIAWGRAFRGSFARGTSDAFDSKVESDTDILKGVRLAYVVTPRVSLEVLAERVDTRFVSTGGGVFPVERELGILQMRFVELGARYALARGRVVPFVGGGLGVAVLDPDIPGRTDIRDSTRLALHLDAGVKAYLTRWLGLRLDARPRFVYLGARREPYDGGVLDSGRWFHQVDGDFGIFVAF